MSAVDATRTTTTPVAPDPLLSELPSWTKLVRRDGVLTVVPRRSHPAWWWIKVARALGFRMRRYRIPAVHAHGPNDRPTA